MARLIGGIVLGFVVWTLLWLGGNAVLMLVFPDGVDLETAQLLTIEMMISSLVLSVVCSLAGGALCGAIARRMRAPQILAGILLLVGLAVETSGWDAALAWYHIVFLVLLVPATLAGAALTKPLHAAPPTRSDAAPEA